MTDENLPTVPTTNRDDEPLDPSFLTEFREFLVENKKWWLIPIVGVLLLLGALVYLSGTAVAPLIYTLF